jgi:hypothetical protein
MSNLFPEFQDMVKPSKSAQLRRKIDQRVQFYGLDALRQFFSAAAKFLIKPDYWDDAHPTTEFDGDPVIQAFHEGFKQFSRADMLDGNHLSETELEFIDLLRQASGWKGTGLHFRVAKRRLTRLRQLMQKFLRSGENTEQPLRGLRFYDKVIRTKYLEKARAKETSA